MGTLQEAIDLLKPLLFRIEKETELTIKCDILECMPGLNELRYDWSGSDKLKFKDNSRIEIGIMIYYRPAVELLKPDQCYEPLYYLYFELIFEMESDVSLYYCISDKELRSESYGECDDPTFVKMGNLSQFDLDSLVGEIIDFVKRKAATVGFAVSAAETENAEPSGDWDEDSLKI